MVSRTEAMNCASVYLIVVLLVLHGHVSSSDSDVLDNLEKICKGADEAPEVIDCIVKGFHEFKSFVFEEGYPKLNIPVGDPFRPGNITLSNENENFKMAGSLIDPIVRGFTGLEDIQGEIDYDAKRFMGSVVVPTLRIQGNYVLRADIGQLVLNGGGTCWAELEQLQVSLVTDFFVEEFDGTPRLQIRNFKFDFMVPEEIRFRFNNLINGDELLDNAANAVLYENRHEIIELFREQLCNAVIDFVEPVINNALRLIDIDDIGGAKNIRRVFNL